MMTINNINIKNWQVFLIDDKGNRYDLPTTTENLPDGHINIRGHLTKSQYKKMVKGINKRGLAELKSFSAKLRVVLNE